MSVLASEPQLPPPSPPAEPPPGEPSPGADLLLRVLGMVLAFGGGAVAAALAVLLIPLRVGSFGLTDGGGAGSVRLPVAIVLAIVGNVALVWFARYATGVRWAPLLPGLSWFAVIVLAMNTTAEGDRLLMPNDWVGTITLFAGTITFVISTMLAVVPTRRADDLR
jgi:hypothetical protein